VKFLYKAMINKKRITDFIDNYVHTIKKHLLVEKFPCSHIYDIRKIDLSGDYKILNSYRGYPTVIKTNGTLMWFDRGVLHRGNDLPAIVKNNGTIEYWTNGNKTRDNKGPVVITKKSIYFSEFDNRLKVFFLNNTNYYTDSFYGNMIQHLKLKFNCNKRKKNAKQRCSTR